MNKIELGDKVKCKYTGFMGIAINRTEFINGCVQIGVAPKVGRDNKLREDICIDEESLIVVKKGNIELDNDESGGSSKFNMKKTRF